MSDKVTNYRARAELAEQRVNELETQADELLKRIEEYERKLQEAREIPLVRAHPPPALPDEPVWLNREGAERYIAELEVQLSAKSAESDQLRERAMRAEENAANAPSRADFNYQARTIRELQDAAGGPTASKQLGARSRTVASMAECPACGSDALAQSLGAEPGRYIAERERAAAKAAVLAVVERIRESAKIGPNGYLHQVLDAIENEAKGE